MKTTLLALGMLMVLMCGTAVAYAESIVVTETTTATGSLDGVAFNNASVTLMLIGNTAEVSASGGVFQLPGIATVSVAGDGSDIFTDQVQAVINNNFDAAGFGDFTNNFGVLFTLNPAFSTADFSSSIGPLSGTDEFNKEVTFSTLGGTFEITFTGGTATFSTTVPEPNSLLLLGTGLAALLGLVRRKRTICKFT